MTESVTAFLSLMRPHWHKLHSLARQYVRCEADSQDLVQETLLRAWSSFSTAEDNAYCRAWLFAIMRNVALDWQRSDNRRARLLLLPDLELTEVAPTDPTEPFAQLPSLSEDQFRELLDDKIALALDALEPPLKEVIILSAIVELRYREIAEVLDCPIGTVMSRMARARRALRERLADFAHSRSPARKGQP